MYQRDVKGEEVRDSKAIRQANIIAHEGDALSDAMLFDRDRLPDMMEAFSCVERLRHDACTREDSFR